MPPRRNLPVSRHAVAIARASYQRCQQAPNFFEAFYQRFFESCEAARPMFANTDFARQHKLLQHAIGLLFSHDQQPDEEPNLLTRVAERHGRSDLAVNPAFYDDFLNSLILTARELDPEFTAETEAAWREATAAGIAYMMSKS
jgi:hemoglobin-like flavoprotein